MPSPFKRESHEVCPSGDYGRGRPRPAHAETLTRPHIKLNDSQIDEEEWEFFLHKWATYKTQANLKVNESFLGEEITEILLGKHGQAGWELLTEQNLLNTVKDIFIKRRNRIINRLKLRSLKPGS